MKRAYIMVSVKEMSLKSVVRVAKRLPYVMRVDVVSGPYDLLIMVEGKTFDEISEFVINQLRQIEGVEHTETWIAMIPHEQS